MIPKTIHYIWLSNDPFDSLSEKCIASWSKILKGYQIVRWDSERCKDIIANNSFAAEAYKEKKWAFVADYLRVYILKKYGGIYCDADIEVYQPFDDCLGYSGFIGFETNSTLAASLIGSEPNGRWITEQLSYYQDRHFILPDGSMDLTCNPTIFANISQSFGFIANGKEQTLETNVHIFPKEVFSPLDLKTGILERTDRSIAVHWFAGSWTTKSNKRHVKINQFLNRHFSEKTVSTIRKILKG